MSMHLRKSELLRSSKSGDVDSVTRLLREKNSVNPNVANNDGETPLILSARYGHVEIFKLLLNHGFDVNRKDSNGWPPLLWACNCGRLDIVRILLARDDVYVDETSNNGATSLMWAAKSNHIDVIKALIRKGADVFRKDQHGSTAIMYACHEGHSRIVQQLLESYHKPEDLNQGNANGTTPLMWACKGGRFEIASTLIARGADVNKIDSDGENALMRAVRAGHEELVDLLIQSDQTKVNTQCKKKISALMLASSHGNVHILTALMEHGAEVNQIDEEGYTSLMYASQEGHYDVVRALLTYGSDLNVQSVHGLTAFDLADRRGHKDVADMLRTITYDRNVEIGRKLMYDNVIHPSAHAVPIPREFPMEYITFCTSNFVKARKKGEGSFGVVYLAQDPKDESIEFVVKRSKIDLLSDKDLKALRDTFEKEIRLLTKCRHSNIVRLYGHSINQRAGKEQLCLLYEYCENGDLSSILSKESARRNLPAYRRVQIMYEISRAINFLHKGGVSEGKSKYTFFHRDIKSSNICLTSDYTAKLIDCGLSKFIIDPDRRSEPGSQTMGMTYFTTTLSIAGTPGYICPHYAQGHPFEAKCDVYSFGVVMLELITGVSQESTSSDRSFSTDTLVNYIKSDPTKLARDVDPIIAHGFKNQLLDLMNLALSCVEMFPSPRPSMDQLVKKLSLLLDNLSGIVSSDPVFTENGSLPNVVPLSIHEIPTSPKKTFLKSESSSTYDDDDQIRCGLCTEKMDHKDAIKCPTKHSLCKKCMEYQVVKHVIQSDKATNLCCPICYATIAMSELSAQIRPDFLLLLNKRSEDENHTSTQTKAIFQMFEELRVKVTEQNARQNRQSRIIEAMKEDRKKDQELLKKMNEKLSRYGEALTELATGKKSPCPRLIIIEPVTVPRNKKIANIFTSKKYNLYFVCEHSFEKVEPPLSFDISQKWIRQVAPFVLVCIRILPLALGIPIPTELFNSIFAGLTGFVDPQFTAAIQGMVPESGNNGGMMGMFAPSHLDATARGQAWEDSARTLTTYNSMNPRNVELVDSSYKAMAEFANKDENKKIWKPKMSLVMNEHGHFIWVIKNYACLYDERESESEPPVTSA